MSIRKRGKGWEIVIEMGKDADGKRAQKTFMFYGTKPEAKYKEAELKTQYKGNTIAPNKMNLEQYMIYWLDTFKANELAVRTYESYKETIEVHIGNDEIGKKPFDRVKPDDIQKYYNRKLEQGLSPTSVLYHHRIMHAAYNQAVKSRLIPWGHNPCAGASPPSKKDYKPADLSPENMAYIISNAIGQPVVMGIIISSMSGTREGEVCALQRPDFDLNNMSIHVHGAIKREGGILKHGPTKNKQERYVPLTPGLAKIMKWYFEEQDKVIAALGEGYNDQGYVLAWGDGRFFDPHYLSEKFTKAIGEMKFQGKVTFHTCRHFYASSMHDKGADVKLIADALGHGKMGNITADTYIHTRVEQMRPFVEWLDKPVLSGFIEQIDAHISAHIDGQNGFSLCGIYKDNKIQHKNKSLE